MKKISTNSSRKIANTNKYMSWMICMLLILVAGIQNVNAQTIPPTNDPVGMGIAPSGWSLINGTTDISNQTYWAGFAPSYPWSGTVGLPPTGHTTWVTGFLDEKAGTTISGLTIGTSYTFTFYAAELRSDAGGSIDNNYDGILSLSNSVTNTTLSTYNFTGGSSNAWNTFTYTFTATATSLPIAFEYSPTGPANGNFWNISIASTAVAVATVCNAGTTAPTLSASTIANVCPATTVNLTSITASNLPGGTTLTWHTGTPATTVNKITTPSAVGAGTYYAAFFDATNNCYSGTSGDGSATTVVTATVNTCCTAGTAVPLLSATTISNVCPTATVNLTSITASNLPGGNTLTWHTGTPATTVNKITTPAAVGAGTYYAAFFDATNNCYSGIGGNGSATTVVTATTTTCAALTANNPTTQTVPGGQVYTGNAGTELAPSGGTGPYTYSNGSSDPACINPGGATALPPASNLTVTNSTTGAYTYTSPTAAGTYFFCVKVCDSTTPTPNCIVKTYTVVVPCAAGSNPPVLIKN